MILSCFFGSKSSRFMLGAVGAVVVSMLIVFSSFLRGAHPAFASGSGAYLYVHTATSANTSKNYTLLDNPVTDNDPNAIVFVTANWNPGGVHQGFDNHQVGVQYVASAGKWSIFNEDLASMPIGASFNVYALPNDSYSGVFVQTATTANTSGYTTSINNAALNGNPSANFLVTQDRNPGGSGGTYNSHAIGVRYSSRLGEWTIYNEDRKAIPNGASFNVVSMVGVTDAFTQVATSSNTSGDSTHMNSSSVLNGNPNELAFITHVYSGYFSDVSAVQYNSHLGEWSIFDGSHHSIDIGATFYVSPTTTYP
jgi:hypothetical protein